METRNLQWSEPAANYFRPHTLDSEEKNTKFKMKLHLPEIYNFLLKRGRRGAGLKIHVFVKLQLPWDEREYRVMASSSLRMYIAFLTFSLWSNLRHSFEGISNSYILKAKKNVEKVRVIFGPFWVMFGPLWSILGHFVAFLDKFAES